MDSYLMEIKQLRIPRPKYEPNSSPPNSWHRFSRPFTPPRDYNDYNLPTNEMGIAAALQRKFSSGSSEDFRSSLHNKM
ncbi:uncharacterized protein LOC119673492 [Teleopsis dalmanni]|uniref:uncharacterized protein LOC119665024 n=1 Tax=Teleopsis dalmanni TaxID=139649 RepID=UPI0018CEBFCE|nr:uncharacterized protein LOC119665024 [Teleopsis dalmanni]XP_037940710.1 uncharacterized protein LOC119673492 [Teleopsis dalmanni]